MSQAEDIATIRTQVNEIHGDMKVLKEISKRHDGTLYGNGKPGLVEKFQSVEEQQRKCPALQKELLSNQTARKANWIQIAMVIVAIAAVVVAILK